MVRICSEDTRAQFASALRRTSWTRELALTRGNDVLAGVYSSASVQIVECARSRQWISPFPLSRPVLLLCSQDFFERSCVMTSSAAAELATRKQFDVGGVLRRA